MDTMMDLALLVGSDVPFFIKGGAKLVEGRGEIINDYNSSILNDLYFLLVIPPFNISTKWAYQNIKKKLDVSFYSNKFPALDTNVDWKFF